MNPLADIAITPSTWYPLYQRYAFAAGPYGPYIGAALPDLLARLDGEAIESTGAPIGNSASPANMVDNLRHALPDWDPSPSHLLLVDVTADEGVHMAHALLAQRTFPVLAWPGPFGSDAARTELARRLVPLLSAAAEATCWGYALLLDRGRLSAGRFLTEDDLPTEEWLQQAQVDTVTVWTREMTDDLATYLYYLERYGFAVRRQAIPLMREDRE